MNKEKLMEVISKLIDEGAVIDIYLSQFDKNWDNRKKDDVLKLTKMFQEAIGSNTEKHETNKICDSVVVKSDRFYGYFCHSPQKYMIDDVDLSGGADHVS